MTSLRILDLDFFQVVTEPDIQVTGGITTISGSLPSDFSDIIKKIKQLKDAHKKLVYSDPSTGVTVNELNNPETGTGYEVLTSDGTSQSHALVLLGPGYAGVSGISLVSSTPAAST